MYPDVGFIARKWWRHYFPLTKEERGFRWTLDSHMDYSEDFNRDTILTYHYGGTFIDAGAHTGMWSIQASSLYAKVIAIEPSEYPRRSLKRNIKANKIRNIKVIPKAVSDKIGIAPLFIWPGGAMGNSLLNHPVNYTPDYGYGGQGGIVETITIDSLHESPSVIKLDVEGAENLAIEGALETIRRCHPALIIEIHRIENEQAIYDMLPEYLWWRRMRHVASPGKTEFDQIHLLGLSRPS